MHFCLVACAIRFAPACAFHGAAAADRRDRRPHHDRQKNRTSYSAGSRVDQTGGGNRRVAAGAIKPCCSSSGKIAAVAHQGEEPPGHRKSLEDSPCVAVLHDNINERELRGLRLLEPVCHSGTFKRQQPAVAL